MTTEALERAAPSTQPATRLPTTIIEPTHAWAALRLREVWKARELIFFLMWRDIKVRYKQTVIGAGWAVLQPLITVLIFTLLLGKYAKLPSGGVPYPLFIFAALLPWVYFSYSITQSGKSVVDNERLITKIFFPRLSLPIATTFTGIPDFFVGCGVFAVMMIIFGVTPTWRIIFIPLFLLMAIAAALGVGLWLSSLNVAYRDVRYILPFLTQIWMLASPVVYFPQNLHGTLGTVFELNPMAGAISGFRWALLYPAVKPHQSPPWVPMTAAQLLPSVGVSLVLIVTGLFFFKHMDKTFADVI
jgi:lipopolysaccharide transport system permease protein